MRLLLLLCCFVIPLQVNAEHPDDPWEEWNREVFEFNETLDKYAAKPVAQAYKNVTPQVVDDAVTNVFSNMGDPINALNALLQGKFLQALSDTGRFIVNSTVGILGIFDVATSLGLEKHNEDFGQTLAVWGVESGPYLYLPVLGPSTLRDTSGLAVDLYGFTDLDPLAQGVDNPPTYYSTAMTKYVDIRADLLAVEGLVIGDKYSFLRTIYFQRRHFLIHDGVVGALKNDAEDAFDDFMDDFGDDEFDEAEFEEPDADASEMDEQEFKPAE